MNKLALNEKARFIELWAEHLIKKVEQIKPEDIAKELNISVQWVRKLAGKPEMQADIVDLLEKKGYKVIKVKGSHYVVAKKQK